MISIYAIPDRQLDPPVSKPICFCCQCGGELYEGSEAVESFTGDIYCPDCFRELADDTAEDRIIPNGSTQCCEYCGDAFEDGEVAKFVDGRLYHEDCFEQYYVEIMDSKNIEIDEWYE